nr:hypothetical protein [Sphingomonas soli]
MTPTDCANIWRSSGSNGRNSLRPEANAPSTAHSPTGAILGKVHALNAQFGRRGFINVTIWPVHSEAKVIRGYGEEIDEIEPRLKTPRSPRTARAALIASPAPSDGVIHRPWAANSGLMRHLTT